MNGTYREIGTAIGTIVDQKSAAYGSSFAKAGDFLRLLWPDGVPPERFDDMLLLVRVFDKQMRIATDKDALGESPFADIAGYGILGASLHQESRARWQGSVSGPRAQNSSKATPDSAAPPTKTPTTQSESEPAVQPPSPQPASSSPQPTDVTVSTAEASASGNAVDRELVLRNSLQYFILTFLHNSAPRSLDVPELFGCVRAASVHDDMTLFKKELFYLRAERAINEVNNQRYAISTIGRTRLDYLKKDRLD